jgi:hypothetical protein
MTRSTTSRTACSLAAIAAVALLLPVSAAAARTRASSLVIHVSPNPAVETSGSEVWAIVQVGAGPALAGARVQISSPQLNGACAVPPAFFSVGATLYEAITSVQNTLTVVVDPQGNGTVLMHAAGCAAGNRQVEADLLTAPFSSATATLTVKAPQTLRAGIAVAPNPETATSSTMASSTASLDGNVYAVVRVSSPSYPLQPVEVDAPQLPLRCAGGNFWAPFANPLPGPNSPTETGTLDADGNATFVFVGTGCVPGSSSMTAVVQAGTHPSYATTFTVLAPRPLS